jgi:hypothetical protein
LKRGKVEETEQKSKGTTYVHLWYQKEHKKDPFLLIFTIPCCIALRLTIEASKSSRSERTTE